MTKMNDEMYFINSIYMASVYYKDSREGRIPIMETVMVKRCLEHNGNSLQYSIIDGDVISTIDNVSEWEYGIDDLCPIYDYCTELEKLSGFIVKSRLNEILLLNGRNLCDQRMKHEIFLRRVLRLSPNRKKV